MGQTVGERWRSAACGMWFIIPRKSGRRSRELTLTLDFGSQKKHHPTRLPAGRNFSFHAKNLMWMRWSQELLWSQKLSYIIYSIFLCRDLDIWYILINSYASRQKSTYNENFGAMQIFGHIFSVHSLHLNNQHLLGHQVAAIQSNPHLPGASF